MSHQKSTNLIYVWAGLLVLAGLALRAAYLAQAHPYIDEYFTILAAKMVAQHGYPRLPSGLFYSHGLLYTYLMAMLGGIVSLFGDASHLLAADMVYRAPNLLISVAALLVIFGVSRRWFGLNAGLLALALLVVYPHGIVWGARVRMYTLLYLLVPLLAYAFFRLASDLANRRRLASAVILAGLAFFVHNWAVLLVPPLLIGVGVVAWQQNRRAISLWRRWLPGLVALAGLVALSLYTQSLWLDTEVAAAQNRGAQGMLDAVFQRLTLAGGNTEFVRQFLIDNPFNLLIVAGVLLAGLTLPWLLAHARTSETARRFAGPMAFLYVVFWGTAAEFVLLLDPFLKQPRYASPLLLLAFIIWGGWLALALRLAATRWQLSPLRHTALASLLALLLVAGFGALAARQIPRLFFEGLPALGYDQAFQFIRQEASPTDPVLSPLPAAGTLYLPNPQYFVAQNATNTFVHINSQGVLADRWTGAPWLKSVEQFKAMLKDNPTVWLAIDQPTLETQFGAAWRQVMRQNTREVWQEDGVTVYRADGLIYDTPSQPEVALDAQLADKLKLAGYTRQMSPDGLRLILFWQVLAPLDADYTTFVHVRNSAGETMAQVDVQPLAGAYPTSRWQPGELIPDEIIVPIPPGLPADTYQLLVGLYRWDTLERLPVLTDKSGENAILLETIEIQPHER